MWDVSGCPGPGWGSVWRSPEENGLGSVSPGTPYRFAWQTEGGRGTRGLPSVSNTTVAICFRFCFLAHPSPSFWINPHMILSQETIEGKRSETSSMSTPKRAKHSLTTWYQKFCKCRVNGAFLTLFQAVFLDSSQCWDDVIANKERNSSKSVGAASTTPPPQHIHYWMCNQESQGLLWKQLILFKYTQGWSAGHLRAYVIIQMIDDPVCVIWIVFIPCE